MSSHLFHRKILDNSKLYGSGVALVGLKAIQKFWVKIIHFQTDAETGEQLSFNEMRRRSHILANYLHKEYSITKGDILICYMPNSIHYPIIFLVSFLNFARNF
jgi:hypothetical protein